MPSTAPRVPRAPTATNLEQLSAYNAHPVLTATQLLQLHWPHALPAPLPRSAISQAPLTQLTASSAHQAPTRLCRMQPDVCPAHPDLTLSLMASNTASYAQQAPMVYKSAPNPDHCAAFAQLALSPRMDQCCARAALRDRLLKKAVRIASNAPQGRIRTLGGMFQVS